MILIVSPFFMKYLVLGHASGITLWPFVVVRDKLLAGNERLINHERIHLKQQLELLLIGFYIWYVGEYLYRFIRFRDHYKAYRMISFEREAFANDNNLEYLKTRSFWGFLKYV